MFLLNLSSHLNEHYKPVMELCHPCVVQYNMYTNFKYLPEDAFQILDLLRIPRYYYLNTESHPQTPTSALLDDFFNRNVTSRLVLLLCLLTVTLAPALPSNNLSVSIDITDQCLSTSSLPGMMSYSCTTPYSQKSRVCI